MNATTTTPTTAYAKGDAVTVTLTDDSTLIGEYLSTASNGTVSIKVDGKIVTRAASRVKSITVNEIDGYTSADLAEMFDTSTRALRRRLRALSMGVGKGRRYNLSDDQLNIVRVSIEGEPIEDDTDDDADGDDDN
jgi:hypothetical protein